MTIHQMQEEILRLKQEQDVCILAHSYQTREILEIADFTGDSFQLSLKAASAPQSRMLLCGVRFMAETVKILSPKKQVLLANGAAGCPMAEQMDKALIRQVYAVKARAENGLNACIAESKAEYRALPKSQKTQTRKLMIVLSKSSELNALQASCDKEMDRIVSQMRTILQENGQSTALADQVMETYKAEKSARYTELKNKFYS